MCRARVLALRCSPHRKGQSVEVTAGLLVHSLSIQPMFMAYTLPASEAPTPNEIQVPVDWQLPFSR